MDYLRADYKRWINADSWTVERAILLLINAEILPKDNGIYDCGPPRTMTEQSDFNKFMEIWPILESSLKYGGLKKLDKGCVGLWNDVSPKDFIHWAKLKGYAIPEELKIISTATQSETVSETVDDACTVKPRKKLKPLERETNEGLLLIYGLCSSRKITYQDELIGIDAWGEIISGNFTSQHIKTYTDKSIIFNSGYKLNKTDFLEKYRKRFAIEE